jgi:hypothetical protein
MRSQDNPPLPTFRLDTTSVVAGLLPLVLVNLPWFIALRGTAVALRYNELVGECILEADACSASSREVS